MLGKPHQVEPEAVEPGDLLENRGIKIRSSHPGFRRVPKVVHDAHAQRLCHSPTLPPGIVDLSMFERRDAGKSRPQTPRPRTTTAIRVICGQVRTWPSSRTVNGKMKPKQRPKFFFTKKKNKKKNKQYYIFYVLLS